MQMDIREEQSANAPFPITRSPDPDSNVTVLRFLQSLKQAFMSLSTLAGMQMDAREGQPLKALLPISLSLDPDSNVTELRCLQPRKQFHISPTTSAGMQMDAREGGEGQPLKAPLPITLSLDPGSNITVLRFLQPLKQAFMSLSTLAGMQMDDREEPTKALLPISLSMHPASNITMLK
jgi:hypothetical protein